VFVPGISFKMKEAVPLFAGLDLIGLFLRRSTFDHAAHLSGAAIGLWYAMYGMPMWSDLQLYLYKERNKK
jgi:membrane associated rhomboid family serine protease